MPVNLAPAVCERGELDLPPPQRGRELSAEEQVRACGVGVQEYQVRRLG